MQNDNHINFRIFHFEVGNSKIYRKDTFHRKMISHKL